MKNNYDVVIIGSGLGGLVAGAKLSKENKQVLVVEQHNSIGGCATTFRRQNFFIDSCLHEIDGVSSNSIKDVIFSDLEIPINVAFSEIPNFYRVILDGIDFTFPSSYQQAISQLEILYPEEKQGIKIYFDTILKIHQEIELISMYGVDAYYKTPSLSILEKKLKDTTVGDFINDIIKNNNLKNILLANTFYYSDDPYNLPLIYYSSVQGSYYKNGAYYIKGGAQNLSNYLRSIIYNNNGKILTNTTVETILTRNMKIKGVTLLDKKHGIRNEVLTNIIIANNSPENIPNMIKMKFHEIFNFHETFPRNIGPSIFSVYLKFKKRLTDIYHNDYSTMIIEKTWKDVKSIKQSYEADFNCRPFIFVDYGAIDSGLTKDNSSIGVISTIDYINSWESLSKEVYKTEKKRCAYLLINRLNKLYNGISDFIEYFDVATPKTIRNYTLNPKGAAYGYSQIIEQSFFRRISNLTRIEGLYLASAWTIPGGGFSGAMISGWLSAKHILKTF
ncbi:hypothetical protein HR11_02450 [Porphyromonas macacae]|uniref:phytoene desaturase family protein n=1 Tax=Porphyromonas macacae TaxID=28115 RepID=UPI00052B6618|nr:NAD(P)/FAD-dependent oxidoreductase [Porphyromonas macacae]KGO00716.1 hypothetical protein HR11_02450 [Porphyromonas macacae]